MPNRISLWVTPRTSGAAAGAAGEGGFVATGAAAARLCFQLPPRRAADLQRDDGDDRHGERGERNRDTEDRRRSMRA